MASWSSGFAHERRDRAVTVPLKTRTREKTAALRGVDRIEPVLAKAPAAGNQPVICLSGGSPYGQSPIRSDPRVMFKMSLLAWSGCVVLLASCAGPDGKVTTSTPTGPGVTDSGRSGTTVETVPSGLDSNDRVTTPLNKEGPAARAAASAEGEPQPGR
jgi:hypothetical protein